MTAKMKEAPKALKYQGLEAFEGINKQ